MLHLLFVSIFRGFVNRLPPALPVSVGELQATQGPLTGAGLFLLHVERVPSCPLPPRPNESIFPDEGTNAKVCCLRLRRHTWKLFIQFSVKINYNKNINTIYLPHAICVTTFPMSSNTFLGLISWFVELCPSCPYPPAPNVNTPPSCEIRRQLLMTDRWTAHGIPFQTLSVNLFPIASRLTRRSLILGRNPTLHPRCVCLQPKKKLSLAEWL